MKSVGEATLRRRLLAWIHPYRGKVIAAVGLLLVQAGLALAFPALTQHAIDVAVPNRDQRLLLWIGGLGLVVLVVTAAAEYLQTVLTAGVGQRVMSDLRRDIFDHLQRLGIPFFDRQPAGRLVTRVTSDVETLNELFSSGLVAVLGDVATVVAVGGMMLWIDWRLALVAFTVLPFLGLVVVVFRGAVRSVFGDIRTVVARMNSYLSEHIGGMRVVQLFDRGQAVRDAFAAINRDHRDAQYRSIFIYSLFFPVVEVLMSASIALLLWYGGLRNLSGALTLGVLAAFIQLVRRFFQPLQDLAEKFNLLQSAMASGERIFQLLDTPVEAMRATSDNLPAAFHGEIVFEDVWFRYADDGPWALQGISFRVDAGKTVALVGATGAGKSSVLSLLLRFYAPTRGRILLDGIDISLIPVPTLRRCIGFVPQDLFLFRGDLSRNLRLDRPIEDQHLWEALRTAGADALVERVPGGLHHHLAERGRSLSVGERQLLSFARAIVGNPAVLLLDEATSAIDPETEARIQVALARARSGRTALVVAHRLGTVVDADQILVFHHGELRESGTHRALLSAEGLYRQLVQLQFGERHIRRSA